MSPDSSPACPGEPAASGQTGAMTPGRRALRPIALVAALVLAGCGSGTDHAATRASGSSGDPGPSTTVGGAVEGWAPADVRAAVTAPAPPTGRRSAGPTAEQVTLPGGRVAWRIRIPGRRPVRSARGIVSVGGTVVGPAIATPAVDALVVVVVDPAVLIAGRPVTIAYGRAPAEPLGPLAVVR